MSFLLKWALALSLISSAFGTEINQCSLIKVLKERVDTDRARLEQVSELYEAKILASEIHERLPELTSDVEILNFADRLESDQDINRAVLLLADALGRAASEHKSDSLALIPFEAVSVGSLILSGHIITRMNKKAAGKGLRALLGAHFKAGAKGKVKYVKYGLNMSILSAFASSLYLAHRTYQNTISARELKELMRALEGVSIDAEHMVTLRNQLEEDIVRIEQIEWSLEGPCL